MDSTAPLQVTDRVIQTVSKICRTFLPSEACGYILASVDEPTIGIAVHFMNNIDEKPLEGCLMDPVDIVTAHKEFDDTGQEPIAIFHSHPTSDPIPSQRDLDEAQPGDIAHLIVSMTDGSPKARAWRMERFIGETVPHQVPIMVVRTSGALVTPPGPWALLPGNEVRIAYQRHGKTTIGIAVATVTSVSESQVNIEPLNKTAARIIPMERIRSVRVTRESANARQWRLNLQRYARRVAMLIGNGETRDLPQIAGILRVAYPPGIEIELDRAS